MQNKFFCSTDEEADKSDRAERYFNEKIFQFFFIGYTSF